MIRAASLLTALLVVLVGCTSKDDSGAQQQQEDYAESSGSFDRDQVQPFLTRLSGLLDTGFGPDEVADVMKTLTDLGPDQESELEFSVTYRGEVVPMNLTLVNDDPQSPDLYFFTSPTLAERLDELMDQYAQELEQDPDAAPDQPAQPEPPPEPQPEPPDPNAAKTS